MNLQLEDLPVVREHHQVRVGRGDEEVLDPVLVLARARAGAPLAAAPLPLVGRDGGALDVAVFGHRYRHVLVGDHVFD